MFVPWLLGIAYEPVDGASLSYSLLRYDEEESSRCCQFFLLSISGPRQAHLVQQLNNYAQPRATMHYHLVTSSIYDSSQAKPRSPKVLLTIFFLFPPCPPTTFHPHNLNITSNHELHLNLTCQNADRDSYGACSLRLDCHGRRSDRPVIALGPSEAQSNLPPLASSPELMRMYP